MHETPHQYRLGSPWAIQQVLGGLEYPEIITLQINATWDIRIGLWKLVAVLRDPVNQTELARTGTRQVSSVDWRTSLADLVVDVETLLSTWYPEGLNDEERRASH